MPITWKTISVALGTVTTIAGIITAGYNFTIWIDNIYVDAKELQNVIDRQNGILNIMNDNIVNIGTAIYDRKIDEIDTWIKELEGRPDRNDAETAFLATLKEQREQVLQKKEKLNKIKVSF